ncbi:MAG: hypothetical protein AAGF07_04265 [Patescibacteria group bacterium]
MGIFAPDNGKDLIDGTVGRKLSWLGYDHTYEELTAQLKSDEALVGLYERARFIAPLLHCKEEFDAYKKTWDDGRLILIDYYAVPNTVVEEWKQRLISG